jgi:hypothetical protein
MLQQLQLALLHAPASQHVRLGTGSSLFRLGQSASHTSWQAVCSKSTSSSGKHASWHAPMHPWSDLLADTPMARPNECPHSAGVPLDCANAGDAEIVCRTGAAHAAAAPVAAARLRNVRRSIPFWWSISSDKSSPPPGC